MDGDLGQAVRTLRHRVGVTSVAVATLAIGIGANCAIFSVVNAVVLRPLPYPHSDRLLAVFADHWFSKEQLAFFAQQVHAYAPLAAYDGAGGGFTLTGADRPELLEARAVTASFFPALAVSPLLGRTFLPEDEQPGRGNVVVLSHELWQRRFASDPQILGKRIVLDADGYTVVGVLRPGFRFLPGEASLFVPLKFDPAAVDDYTGTYLLLLGRLREGVTAQQAGDELRAAARRMGERFALPAGFGKTAAVVGLREQMVGSVRPLLLILLGAVGCILLIACANVANLMLTQALDRRREIAVRIALGVGRGRLVRQLLTESLVLAIAGGAAGLALAYGATGMLLSRLPADLPRAGEIGIDLNVLWFTLAISMVTGILFGLAPIFQTRKLDLQESLKEGSRGAGTGVRGTRLHGLLVVAETALAFVLLVGAGLLIKSFWRLANVNPGFDADHLLTLRVQLPETRYPTAAGREVFLRQVMTRLAGLPGVASVGGVHFLPLTGRAWVGGIRIEDQPALEVSGSGLVAWRVVTPGYLETLGLHARQGRTFTSEDRADSAPAAVVSEALVRRYFPHQDPLGKRLRRRGDSGKAWWTIVGTVPDIRHESLAAEPDPVLYQLYSQVGQNLAMSFLLRTRTEPATLAQPAARAVWAVDAQVPVFNLRTMREVISTSMSRPRLITSLLSAFAAAALLLGLIGVYAVLSYTIRGQTHEIGVRMALGADRATILGWALGRSLRLTGLGVASGLIVSLATTRLLSRLLFRVSPTDPATFLLIALVLVGSALLGSYVPCRRATRVSPTEALREGA
ncbi:MAG TPA: ABC transporter permease [Thermoanaerobaculia bacterium]|nr:ABC transporter permease [Thermoanaerobaculia bacterium]